MIHIFHKWSKWETYTWIGEVFYTRDTKGEYYTDIEKRQKRTCVICGKEQNELLELLEL